MSTYGFASLTRILCCYSQDGTWHLAWLDTETEELTRIESGYTDISHIRTGKGFAAFFAGSPTQPSALVRMDLDSGAVEPVRAAFEVTVDAGYFSIPESITYPTDG